MISKLLSRTRIVHLIVGIVLGCLLSFLPRVVVTLGAAILFCQMVETKIPITHEEVRAERINRVVIFAGVLLVVLIAYAFRAL